MVGGDMRTGEDHLVKIQPVTKDQKYGHKCYRAPVAFRAPLHQDQQGTYKVDYEVQIEYSGIGAVKPHFEINGLLGDVRIPDEHELVEPQVTPEDGEGEHELTKVMQVFFVDILE